MQDFYSWVKKHKGDDMVVNLPGMPFEKWLEKKGHIPKKPEVKREKPKNVWCPNGYTMKEDGTFVPDIVAHK